MAKYAARRLVLSCAVVALFIPGCRASKPPKSNAAGDQRKVAADFTLDDIFGKPLTLADYRGKVILLDFWATWCDVCAREEVPQFVKLQDKYRERSFQIIGISMDDSPKPVREFYRKFQMNYPVAIGTAKLADAYGGILGLPVAFLIDRDGRIEKKFVGATDLNVLEDQIKTMLASP